VFSAKKRKIMCNIKKTNVHNSLSLLIIIGDKGCHIGKGFIGFAYNVLFHNGEIGLSCRLVYQSKSKLFMMPSFTHMMKLILSVRHVYANGTRSSFLMH
jgi:hypothetical protein